MDPTTARSLTHHLCLIWICSTDGQQAVEGYDSNSGSYYIDEVEGEDGEVEGQGDAADEYYDYDEGEE